MRITPIFGASASANLCNFTKIYNNPLAFNGSKKPNETSADTFEKRIPAGVAAANAKATDRKQENAKTVEILEKAGIETKEDEQGWLTISHFPSKDREIKLERAEELLKNVKEIEGDVDLTRSDTLGIKKFEHIKHIGGNLVVAKHRPYSQCPMLEDMGELETIGGKLNLYGNENLKTTGKIKEIGGNAIFSRCSLADTGEIERIGGNVDVSNSAVNFTKLKYIGGSLGVLDSNISDFGVLEEVEGDLDIFDSYKLKTLGNVRRVGGYVSTGSAIVSLGALEEVGGSFYMSNDRITSLEKLRVIKKDAMMYNCKNLMDLGALEDVGGDFDITNDRGIKSLGKVARIGGNAVCRNSGLVSTGALREVGGNFNVSGTNVSNIDNLETVGGDLIIINCPTFPHRKRGIEDVQVCGKISE